MAEVLGIEAVPSQSSLSLNGAAEFLRQLLASLASPPRVDLVRADSGSSHPSVLSVLAEHPLEYVMAARLTHPVQSLCGHDDACWQDTDAGAGGGNAGFAPRPHLTPKTSVTVINSTDALRWERRKQGFPYYPRRPKMFCLECCTGCFLLLFASFDE